MLSINPKISGKSTFLGLSSFQMLAMFRRGMFYTYLSIYMRDFLLLSVTETTLYATLPMLVSVIFQNFVWGPLSDRFQKRRTFIILGEILAGIGTFVVWFVHSIVSNLLIAGYVIIVGLMCIEAFWSMSNISWSALISDIYPSKERSKIMGQLTSVGGFGRIIGISIGGILYNNGFGFRDGPLFIVASLVMFMSSIPMIFTPEGGIKDIGKIEVENNENPSQNFNFKAIFIVFIISLTFINFGRNSIATIYSQYLILDTGFAVDSILLSFIANTQSLAVLTIGFLAGTLSKKFGHSRTLILGVSLSILALIIMGLTDNLILIFVGSFFIGTGEVIIYAASYVIASNLIPSKVRAKLFGVYNTTFFLSWGLACTIISGPLIDFLINNDFEEVISYQAAFLVGALITGTGLVIFLLLEIWIKSKSAKK
ncbi:MAG TPA: MFS transporter [Candidatus Nanopelagicaceae bacterium]|nr:MFS transporter [Candidatus Nanopelagicaceae bacterium]